MLKGTLIIDPNSEVKSEIASAKMLREPTINNLFAPPLKKKEKKRFPPPKTQTYDQKKRKNILIREPRERKFGAIRTYLRSDPNVSLEVMDLWLYVSTLFEIRVF